MQESKQASTHGHESSMHEHSNLELPQVSCNCIRGSVSRDKRRSNRCRCTTGCNGELCAIMQRSEHRVRRQSRRLCRRACMIRIAQIMLQAPTAGTCNWKRNQRETAILVGPMTLKSHYISGVTHQVSLKPYQRHTVTERQVIE